MPDSISKRLFRLTRETIPASSEIALSIIKASKFDKLPADKLREQFSQAVEDLQIKAYREYQRLEASNAGRAIATVFKEVISSDATRDETLEVISSNFFEFDRFSLSLTQSRRSRAGGAFEVIVAYLFDKLKYPYTAQPDIGGSTPDYVLPNIERYDRYPSDCIILTLKRTLRERWRQIVTESSSGRYYLATIDRDVSKNGLDQMMRRNITVVVPIVIKTEKYNNAENVISFEDFFEHHLDPALRRWRSTGAITD